MMAASFESLKEGILACRHCRDLFGFEPRPFFYGGPQARIMQISQAPSRRVHLSLKPFDDASGRNLRKWYGLSEAAFYHPANFYFSALAHCYPGRTGHGDRPPPPSCGRWLRQEMEVVANVLYVIIGRQAAEFLFPGQEFSRLVFAGARLKGRPALVLPHPSPRNVHWLRRGDLAARLAEVRQLIQEILIIKDESRR